MITRARLTSRPYEGARDLPAMQALLRDYPNPFEMFSTAADLPEVLDPTVSNTPSNTLVWEDEADRLAGFAIVSQYHNLHHYFRPSVLTADVEREMMDWAVERLRVSAKSDEAPLTLDASARDDDALKVALLRRHGFTQLEDAVLRMSRSLNEPFPEPQLPPRFALRALAGEAEVPAYVATHRAAYGTERMTEQMRLSIMRQPHYRPQLDLVAVAPDENLAAFCVCNIDDAENERGGSREGEVAIVGTHPDFRGRRLGLAMVLAGMRALRQEGMDTAWLTVGGDNTAAIRAYEAAGFREDWRMRWYAKEVDRRPRCPAR